MRLMVITAHPDDEAANFGGSLRLYHDRGIETCVVCLTAGTAASHRGGAKNDAELAAMRRQEFAASCEILGVTRGIMLDHPDGKLHRVDPYHVVAELTRQVRDFRPQVMATFGPEGGVTGHTDHSMAGIFATLAFHWAGRNNRFPEQLSDNLHPHQPGKLYYSTALEGLPGRQPVTLSPTTTIIDVAKYVPSQLTAFKAHASQAPLVPIFERHLQRWDGKERYHLAASVHQGQFVQETDLFTQI